MPGSRGRGRGQSSRGEVQPQRRSDRIAALGAKRQRADADVSLKPKAQSAQKAKRGLGKPAAGRRSAPSALPIGYVRVLKPWPDWQSLQPEILECVVGKLRAPRQVAVMRQVCKMWSRAVEYGVQTIQNDNPWSDANLLIVPVKFPSITSLDLQNCEKLATGSLTPLLHLPKLQHLRLNHGLDLARFASAVLSKLTDLVTLSLPGCSSLLSLYLVDFTSLQRLDLTGCHSLSDLSLVNLPSLTCLSLRECRGLEGIAFECLRALTALTAIDMSYCLKATNDSMACLHNLPQLSLICLNCCRNITDEGLLDLQAVPRLATLYLDGCTAITEEGMLAIKQQAPQVNMIRIF